MFFKHLTDQLFKASRARTTRKALRRRRRLTLPEGIFTQLEPRLMLAADLPDGLAGAADVRFVSSAESIEQPLLAPTLAESVAGATPIGVETSNAMTKPSAARRMLFNVDCHRICCSA